MRTINIFLASSDELMNDRNSFQALIASLDDIFERRGIRIKCRRWEDLAAYCTGERTQDDYNRIVRASDICICMFHTKAGEYTIEEFNQAFEEYKSNKDHPKTYVYIRALVDGEIESDELSRFKEDLFKTLGHYWCNYATDDTMKLHFIMQFERLVSPESIGGERESRLNVENGIVTFEGRKIADFENISFASANTEYKALKEKYANLDKDIAQLRALGIDENQDFLRNKVIERVKCHEEIQKLEAQMLDMASLVNKMISSGNPISERKRLAIEMFEAGNIKGVIDVLNEEDMAMEAKLAEQEIARGRALQQDAQAIIDKGLHTIRSQVEEYILKAKALMLDIEEPNRFELACKAYENAIALSKKNLPQTEQIDNMFEYAYFLSENNQFTRAEIVNNEILQLIQTTGESWDKYDEVLSILYNNLGVLYRDTKRFDESEQMYKAALEIRKRLAKENPQVFEPSLAASYNNLGILYGDTQRFNESEQMFKAVLEIHKRLAKDNPQAFEPDLAMSYNNLGNLYHKTKRFNESEQMYKSATEIYERLAKDSPQAFEPNLATSYISLGNLYSHTQRFDESEQMYKASLEIYERLAKNNPQAFEPDLAMTCNNLGSLYYATQRFDECEQLFKAALGIRERLAKNNPQAFEPDLAMTCNNLGILYSDTQRFDESEQMYKASLEIYERLAKSNPQAFVPDLAMSYNNLGALYHDINRFEECEQMHKAALEIRKRLAKENPQAFEPDLAMYFNNLGNLYRDMQRFEESEQMCKAALEIYERLANANPQAFEPNLAMSCNNLGNLYIDTQRFEESEQMYKAALEIRERLAKDNPQAFEPDLAGPYNNLGVLYGYTQRFEECEQMYKAALEIYERLAKVNPQAFEPDLADSYNNLGLLYGDMQRFDESEQMYKAALEIRERLAKDNPQAFEPDLAMTYHNLGILYSDTQRFDESEQMYKAAIEIRKRLAKDNPQAYEPDLALSYNNLGVLYCYTKRFEECEQMCKVVLEIYRKDIEKWHSRYAYTLLVLSFCLNLQGKFEEGEQYSLEALRADSSNYYIYTNLAAALLLQGKVGEAEKIYRQYKDELKDGFLSDFDELDRFGVIPEARKADVERIKAMLLE